MANNKMRKTHKDDEADREEHDSESRGASKKKKQNKASKHHAGKFSSMPRPFWTGMVSFGLVALPVSLYAASRGKPSLLNMVDKSGTRLSRRYLCSKDKTVLSPKDIVRGYEVEKDQYVTIDDDELESLAPEKSNDIDLQRFVDLDQIDPIYFDKGYFLAPDSGAIKAYRLLAESMEQENRAGIATFVMRDKEYLVAIVSEGGILRAETLRFHDEVRAPVDVGLTGITSDSQDKAITKLADKMLHTFESMATDELDRDKLEDHQTARIKEKVQQKLKKNQDVIADKPIKARVADEAPRESAEVVDLMQLIKARILGEKAEAEGMSAEKSAKPSSSAKKNKSTRSTQSTKKTAHGKSDAKAKEKLAKMTRDELYERAQALDISGRSKMSKQQLIEALPPS